MKRALVVCLLLCSLFVAGPAFASEEAPASGAIASTSEKPKHTTFTVGFATRTSTLGFGADVAVPVTRKSNARVGFNLFNYDRTFSKDRISYQGTLALKSVGTMFDVFPFGGNFHLSPGILVYNQNRITANAAVAGQQTFTLGGYTYAASLATPITGTAKLDMSRVAPMFLIGWGNLIPRSHRHWTFSVEGGVAYQGTPKATLDLAGNACDVNGVCVNAATDPTIQSRIVSEQNKINDSISAFKYYPVVSFGFGYKF